MTIRQKIRDLKEQFQQCRVDSPALTAGVLLCHILDCDRTYLFTQDTRVLTAVQEALIAEAAARICRQEPLDYVTGCRYFMGMPFQVGPGVLIPRQDTELLVEEGLAAVTGKAVVRILDLCTGSGCVALSLTSQILSAGRTCSAVGIDISESALQYARINGQKLGLEDHVRFMQADVLNTEYMERNDLGIFTLISINPPYIPSEDIIKLDQKVQGYEPLSALDGGTDGLRFYREILSYIHLLLEEGGTLALEIGYDQGDTVPALIRETGRFDNIRVCRDLAGLDRVVLCQLE